MLIDVGSGNYPHPQAEVTCDLYFNAELEGGAIRARELKNFVICDAHHLPFKDQIFQESNCTHVLEHLDDPQLGFRELKRVSKHGYIETPNLFYEQILFGYAAHDWVFIKKNGKLYFREPRRLKMFGRTVLPLGWFTLPLIPLFTRTKTKHKELAPFSQPLQKLLLSHVQHRWP